MRGRRGAFNGRGGGGASTHNTHTNAHKHAYVHTLTHTHTHTHTPSRDCAESLLSPVRTPHTLARGTGGNGTEGGVKTRSKGLGTAGPRTRPCASIVSSFQRSTASQGTGLWDGQTDRRTYGMMC